MISNQKVHSSYQFPNKTVDLGIDPPASTNSRDAKKEAHLFTGDDAQVTFAVDTACDVVPWVWCGAVEVDGNDFPGAWFALPTITAAANSLYKFEAPKRALVFLETDEVAAPEGYVTSQD